MRDLTAKALVLIAIFVPLVVGSTSAEATPPRGGNGGQPFNLDCGGDAVLAGVVARTGALVDSVEAVCVKVKADGSWAGGHVTKGRAGGGGGAPSSMYCDEGWAVIGIHGGSAALVDRLGVRCGKLGAQGGVVKVVQGNTMRGPSGGKGGNPFDDTCPAGQVGRGLRGRAGSLIDQIELVCHNPSVPAGPTTAQRSTPVQRSTPTMARVGGGPDKLEVEVPCGTSPVRLQLQRPNEGVANNNIPPLTVEWAEHVEVPLCVTPGWTKYTWDSTVGPPFSLRDTDKTRAILAFDPRPGSGGSGFRFENGQWRALFGAYVYVEPSVTVQGLDPRRFGYVLFPVVVRNMPVPPTITRVWIEDYRPGRPGPLEHFGVVDPALVGNPDNIDGEFFVEGQGLAPKNRRVTLGGREATVLQHTTSGGVERLKLKASNFAPGRVVVEGSGARGQSAQSLKRLGYWVMANDVLPTFLQDLSVVIGSPRGQASLTLLGQTTSFPVQGYRQGGVSLDVVDMRSRPVTVTVRQVGDEIEYTIAIPFETDGRELDGTFLGTVEYWRCGSFEVPKSRCGSASIDCFLGVIGNALRSSASCLNPNNWSTATAPGPSVALSGDLSNPRATLTTKLGIGNGRLVHRGTTLNFSAGISLSAAGVSLPIEAIQSFILSEVNSKLTNAVKPNDLGTAMANRLQQLAGALTGQGSQLEHVVAIQDGSVFFGFHRP